MSDFGLYRSLGSSLIDRGKWFLNKATPIEKVFYPAAQIISIIKSFTGISNIYSADEKHATTDIDAWKTIIDSDWTDKKKWVEDIFDCDNFAGSFSSYVADIYSLNSCGRVTVELKVPVTGEHVGYHRACIIVDSKLNCWLLESQTDKMVQIEMGKSPIIDNWEYRFISVEIN